MTHAPPVAEFERAMAAYRQAFPRDGWRVVGKDPDRRTEKVFDESTMYRIFSLDEMTGLLSQTGFRVMYAGHALFLVAAVESRS